MAKFLLPQDSKLSVTMQWGAATALFVVACSLGLCLNPTSADTAATQIGETDSELMKDRSRLSSMADDMRFRLQADPALGITAAAAKAYNPLHTGMRLLLAPDREIWLGLPTDQEVPAARVFIIALPSKQSGQSNFSAILIDEAGATINNRFTEQQLTDLVPWYPRGVEWKPDNANLSSRPAVTRRTIERDVR